MTLLIHGGLTRKTLQPVCEIFVCEISNNDHIHSTYFLCFLLHNIRKWQDSREMGRPILITLYHFHLFREHLEIS